MIATLAAVWGALHLALGASRAAAIPWLYVTIAVAGVALFAVHRSFQVVLGPATADGCRPAQSRA